MDIIKLLQPTGADALDEGVYNLRNEHPQNGFYDTSAFKRIRSKELASANRARTSSTFKHKLTGKRNLSTHCKASAQCPRSGPKLGGTGKILPQRGQKTKNPATKVHSVRR